MKLPLTVNIVILLRKGKPLAGGISTGESSALLSSVLAPGAGLPDASAWDRGSFLGKSCFVF